jgi:hypothetical protein
MFISKRRPEFASQSDQQMLEMYLAADNKRQDLIHRMDDSDSPDFDKQIHDIEYQLFAIDDELCARNLDLPR